MMILYDFMMILDDFRHIMVDFHTFRSINHCFSSFCTHFHRSAFYCVDVFREQDLFAR